LDSFVGFEHWLFVVYKPSCFAIAFPSLQVKPKDIHFHRKKNLQYYDISAKSNYNFEKPFLYIIRRLTGKPDAHFVKAPALQPAEVQIDEAQIQKYERELEEANAVPLPDDEEDM